MVIYCFCLWEWLAGSTSFPLAQILERPTVRACVPSAQVQHGAIRINFQIVLTKYWQPEWRSRPRCCHLPSFPPRLHQLFHLKEMNKWKTDRPTIVDLLPVLSRELLKLVVFLENAKIVLLLDLRIGHVELFVSLLKEKLLRNFWLELLSVM